MKLAIQCDKNLAINLQKMLTWILVSRAWIRHPSKMGRQIRKRYWRLVLPESAPSRPKSPSPYSRDQLLYSWRTPTARRRQLPNFPCHWRLPKAKYPKSIYMERWYKWSDCPHSREIRTRRVGQINQCRWNRRSYLRPSDLWKSSLVRNRSWSA